MKTFNQIISEARKIKPLDPRYGTDKDPRLDITSDEAYKQSGSGTGIWRAGIGHNPDIFGVNPRREIMSAEEREKADATNRQREFAKREKGRSREELQNRFDPYTTNMTLPEIGKKMGITKGRVDSIIRAALAKIAKQLAATNFDPSAYSNQFGGEFNRYSKD